MKRTSLARELLVSRMVTVVVACTLLACVFVSFAAVLMLRDQDANLRSLAQGRCLSVSHSMAAERCSLEQAVADVFANESVPGVSFEYWRHPGLRLAHDDSFPENLALVLEPGECITVTPPPDTVSRDPLRACAESCQVGGVLRVVSPYRLRWSLVRGALLGLALAVPLVSIIGAIVGNLTLRRRLAPLGALSDAVRGLEAGRTTPLGVGARAEELATLEKAIDDLMARLNAALEREKRFARDASHELRTPLTVLHGRLETLRARLADRPELEEQASAALREARHLARLVEALLLLARAEGHELPSAPVNLCDVARELAARHEAAGEKAVEVDAPDEILVRGSEELLARAVENLVENARKHAGPQARVRVRVTRDPRLAHVSVADDGPGIAPEERSRMFERFVRGPRRAEVPGVGLGLAVVRSVMEWHGGQVAAGPSDLGGEEIRLSLPLLV